MPKLDHVAIQVSNMEASIAFYTQKLGLKLLYSKVDEQHGEAFAFLELEGGNLELLQQLGAESADYVAPQIRQPYCPHFALASDDLDATLAELKQNNVPVVAGPLEFSDTVRWLYLRDPDNNIIEYIQYLKEGPA
ncbi:MAG: VOC family protein [Planctomycetales bacterium]